MNLKSHRLFIGKIPAGTTEQELSKEFKAYGNVESIEIKTKTNLLNNEQDVFAFVTLQTEDRIVPQCIKEFQQQKFKGVYLNVSRAKESFLEKLKREREEAQAQKSSTSLLEPHQHTEETKLTKEPAVALPVLPTLGKGNESSSSDSSESESEEEASPEEAKPVVHVSKPQTTKEQDGIVKKWNQETYLEYGKLRILPVTGQVAEVIDRSKPHQKRSEDKKLGENARIADEKRKQGLSNLKSAYEQQKLAIKSALAGESQNSSKKITFDDEENHETSGNKKLSLFDTQEEEDDDFKGNFALRKQMLGEEGQKLYELQTSFQADNRFRLDDRFLEDGGKSAESKTPQAKAKDKERMKQLEILSNVTGRPISTESRVDGKTTLQMQRFDPLLQKDSNQKDKQPKETVVQSKKAERREEDFKVSDEKFFKVADNFTISSQSQSQGFSLLAMFGKATKSNQNAMEIDSTLADKPLKSDTRFRYESSDSEDEQNRKKQKTRENGKKKKAKAAKQKLKPPQPGPGYYTKQGIWKESFFFIPNDTRLEAGRKFLGFVPGEDGNVKSAKEAVAGLTESDIQNVRLLYKKRRYRESRFVQKESKFGFRRLKKKTMTMRNKVDKPK